MTSVITIAVQCHNFQRRFCWMLSSLAQQTKPGLIDVRVDHVDGNGTPSVEDLLKEFSGRVQSSSVAWAGLERFQYRGLVRNDQIESCKTEWIMFGDCDMVYHPEYFERLAELLRADHPMATYMLSSGRTSNPKELTKAMVDESEAVRCSEVLSAFARASSLPRIRKGNVGAGFSQIVNVRHAPHGGYYVKESENKDWRLDKRGWNTKSDMQFRKRISSLGGPRRPLPDWFSSNAIHLNHNRDPEAGRHITEQR